MLYHDRVLVGRAGQPQTLVLLRLGALDLRFGVDLHGLPLADQFAPRRRPGSRSTREVVDAGVEGHADMLPVVP